MFGDYNRDGVIDFSYFTSSEDFDGLGIRLGTRPGEFGSSRSAPLPGNPNIADVDPGDFNGDGIIDILDTEHDLISLGNGDGTYQTAIPASGVSRPDSPSAVADFNLDGIDDYVAARANQNGSRYYVAISNGNGTFRVSDDKPVENSFYGYYTFLIHDFNRDGYPDFLAHSQVERQIDVHLNNPSDPGVFSRSFRFTLPAGSQDINVANWENAYSADDVTGDGIVDLVFAERDNASDGIIKIIVMAGNGAGDFTRVSERPLHQDTDGINPFTANAGPGDFLTGDLDHDGDIDLIAGTTAGPRVFRNDGLGHFDFLEHLWYPGASGRARESWLIDFNGDGSLDLISAVGAGPLSIRLGNGDGTFAASQSIGLVAGIPGPISRMPFADIDGDGYLDFVHAPGRVGNLDTKTNSIYAGRRDDLVDLVSVDLNSDGNEEILAVQEQMDRLQIFVGDNLGNLTRQPDLLTGRAPKAVAVGDLNNDGHPELLTVNRASRTISVFSGSLDSGFQYQEYAVGDSLGTATGPIDIELADINGDELVDIVVLDEVSKALWIYLGDGSTTLSSPIAYALGDRPSRFVLADATGDGLIDAVVTLPDSQRLMILNGVGLQPSSSPIYIALSGNPSDVAVLDLNEDGHPDLATTIVDNSSADIYYGRGNNQFARPQAVRVGVDPNRITVVDADEDGRSDLIVTNSGDDTVSVIYNRFDSNEVYRYDADAIDPDNDILTYSIQHGPGGLIINSNTGQLLWAASPDQVGIHNVTIVADDGRGGIATQNFKIEVVPARENSAPIIASNPIDRIGANEAFEYQLHAIDADHHPLRYTLVEGPQGASIDPTTGILLWDGRTEAANYGIAGQGGNIQVPYSPSLKPASITVEGWFQLTGIPRTNTLMQDQGYAVWSHEWNQSFRAGVALTGETLQIVTSIVPKTDQWYHLAFTYDAETGQANLYVDGSLVGTATASVPKPMNTTPGITSVGNAAGGSQAKVDNYRIWNYARSNQEIQSGMLQHDASDPRLVLDYRFFDSSETASVHDHSTYKNTGYHIANGTYLQPTKGLAETGIYEFRILVEDGRGGSDTQSFSVNVLPELRASLSGVAFVDLNDNGTKDTDEAFASNVLAFIDSNNNGYADPEEPQSTTDTKGAYRFAGLLPGEYLLRVLPTAGFAAPAVAQKTVDVGSGNVHDIALLQLTLSQIRGSLRTESDEPISYSGIRHQCPSGRAQSAARDYQFGTSICSGRQYLPVSIDGHRPGRNSSGV